MSLGDRPFCAIHAGAYATGTCPRCGNFACGSCMSATAEGQICLSCMGRKETGRVGQLPLVGALMMVQGGLVTLLGSIWLLGGSFAGLGIFLDPNAQEGAAAGAAVLGVFGCFALCILSGGVLGMVAGWRVRQGRSRTLAFIGLIVVAFAGINMLCWLTGIGLLIFGLIVLVDPDVKRHFEANARRD